jgi:hypothetical protein
MTSLIEKFWSILFPHTDLIFLHHLHRKEVYRKFGIDFHMFLHASHFHHLNSALGLETIFSQLSKFKLNVGNFFGNGSVSERSTEGTIFMLLFAMPSYCVKLAVCRCPDYYLSRLKIQEQESWKQLSL